ncbi:MAG: hypothetical protein LUG99_09240 [Lachnospiraceae bacterium]|nr:hypothetical protein [Lachnospiraceae bacterium]
MSKNEKSKAPKVTVKAVDGLTYADQMAAKYIKDHGIFICSKCRPDSENEEGWKKEWAINMDRGLEASRFVSMLGFIPFCPHIYATQFLDEREEDEREMGIRIGQAWLKLCKELWIFGYAGTASISKGMRAEIHMAKNHGIPIKCFPEPQVFFDLVNSKTSKMDEKEGYKYLMGIIEKSVYKSGAEQAPVYGLIIREEDSEGSGDE